MDLIEESRRVVLSRPKVLPILRALLFRFIGVWRARSRDPLPEEMISNGQGVISPWLEPGATAKEYNEQLRASSNLWSGIGSEADGEKWENPRGDRIR